MQAGGVRNTDVYQVQANLWINGTDVATDVQSVSVERDIPSGLPGSGGGLRAASGSVTATRGDDVSSQVQHPWNRTGNWPPQPMDSVRLDLSDGESSWQQLHGAVDGAVGDASSRQVSFDMVDHYQALDRQVTIEPLLDAMPALEEAATARYIGLQSSYVTDRVLRSVGRFATPPMASGCIVSAPLMGSTWPERGVLNSSIRNTDGAYPAWTGTNYGVAVQDVDARYAPAIHSGENGVFNRPLEITAEWLPNMEGSNIRVYFGATNYLSIVFTATSAVVRFTNTANMNIRTAVRVDAAGTKQRVTARFTLSGNTLSASVRSSMGNGDVIDEGSGSITVPAGSFSSPMTEVRIVGPGTIGAFQVGFPATPFPVVGYERSAVISTTSTARNALKVLPSIVNVKATSLLNSQANAELASWWIDETNVLRWMDRGTLRSRPPVGTLTTADHVKNITWAHNFESVRSSVTVKWKDPIVDRRWRTDLTLWESSGGKIYEGDVQEEIISVPADEVWIMPAGVDLTPQQGLKVRVTASNTAAEMLRINYGQWTIVGGIRTDTSGNQALSSSINARFTKITDDAFKVTVTCGSITTGAGLLQLPTETGVLPGLWSAERGRNLPVLRGKGKAKLVDAATTSATTGPANAPEHIIDAGWWIQYPEQAQAIADAAAAIVTVPQPMITGLDIVPVFNLQLGDVVTVNAPDVMGITITGVVTSNRLGIDFESASVDQSISLRPV